MRRFIIKDEYGARNKELKIDSKTNEGFQKLEK